MSYRPERTRGLTLQQSGKLTLILAAVVVALGCNVNGGDRGDFGDGDGGDGGADAPGDDDDDDDAEGGTGDDDDDDDDGQPGDDDDAQDYVEEARAEFPTYMDLHEKVITRTCTPFTNVCHNNKEYPELDTPLSVLSYFDQDCMLPEQTADPESLYNGCEPQADRVVFVTGPNAAWAGTDVAYVQPVEGPGGPTSFEVHLRDPIPQGIADPTMPDTVRFTRVTGDGQELAIDEIGQVVYGAGASYFTVVNAAGLPQDNLDNLTQGIIGGDLNRDGIYGHEDPEIQMRELVPGNPWQSYMLQRLQGNVPGSPMPLANQPLSAAEIVAIGCWIEGADTPEGKSVEAVIDYDNCEYAADFGTPPEDSGATLSGHVQPIFDAACSFAGCHSNTNPAGDLDLSKGNARDALLDTVSTQVPSIDLVELGNPTNSYLVKKIAGADDIANAPMPPEGYERLTEEQIAVIKLWISYGAPND